jgi:hypothetical protein
VQRLACEFVGVAVPPETHFFTTLPAGLARRRRRFPLETVELTQELAWYANHKAIRGLELDTRRLVERLNGRCASLTALFAALLAELTEDAEIVGEKTPEHLIWWRPITEALPGLRLIVVVRDPRSVVASTKEVPWGHRSHAVWATRWRMDSREILAARRELGARRCLVLRYEDVVREPETARRQLGEMLGLSVQALPIQPANQQPIFLPWETWKSRALAPITTERIERYREVLSSRQVKDVEAICAREMISFGYNTRPAVDSIAALQMVHLRDVLREETLYRLRLVKINQYLGRRYRMRRNSWRSPTSPEQA